MPADGLRSTRFYELRRSGKFDHCCGWAVFAVETSGHLNIADVRNPGLASRLRSKPDTLTARTIPHTAAREVGAHHDFCRSAEGSLADPPRRLTRCDSLGRGDGT